MNFSTAMNMPAINARTTRTCVIWKDRFLHGRFREGAEVTLEDARENVAVTSEIVDGKQYPLLVDLRQLRSQSADAREFFSSGDALLVSNAVALLVASPLSRAIGNFYIRINRPAVPTRVFTDEDEAERWLATYISTAEKVA